MNKSNICKDTTVFTSEQTGEYTLITVVLGEETLTIKIPRDFRRRNQCIRRGQLFRDKGFIFDAVSGDRADAGLTQ